MQTCRSEMYPKTSHSRSSSTLSSPKPLKAKARAHAASTPHHAQNGPPRSPRLPCPPLLPSQLSPLRLRSLSDPQLLPAIPLLLCPHRARLLPREAQRSPRRRGPRRIGGCHPASFAAAASASAKAISNRAGWGIPLVDEGGRPVCQGCAGDIPGLVPVARGAAAGVHSTGSSGGRDKGGEG